MSSNTNNQQSFDKRFGKAVSVYGHTQVPNLLIEHQGDLQISATSLNILIILLKHFWSRDKMPYPSKDRMASMIGAKPNTVRRHTKELEERGFLTRKERYQENGRTSNEYDLTPLLNKLDELAKNRKAKESDAKIATKNKARTLRK